MAVSSEIAARFQLLLRTVYGEHGGPMLAEELKVPFRRVLRWSTGEETIPDTIAKRVAAICHCSLEWLLEGRGTMFPHSLYREGPETLN